MTYYKFPISLCCLALYGFLYGSEKEDILDEKAFESIHIEHVDALHIHLNDKGSIEELEKKVVAIAESSKPAPSSQTKT